MGTVVIPRLVDVVDLFSAQRYQSTGGSQHLAECQVEPWGLSITCSAEEAGHDDEITWLLPDLGLRLTQYRPRRRHARRESTLVTAVNIERDTRSWTTTDLLLGLEVPEYGTTRVVKHEDFASAVSEGLIRLSEADYALRTVHRTMEELSRHRDVNQWLAYRGIFDAW